MEDNSNEPLELQKIITKMPMEVFTVSVLPEFGLHWKELSRAIKTAKLPMCSSSVARILCKHASELFTQEELDEILRRLKLKLVSIQSRTWHVIHLKDQVTDEPFNELLRELPRRVLQALMTCNAKQRHMKPVVGSIMTEDLLYLSIQFVSTTTTSSTLYVATPPGLPVALVSSIASVKQLKALAIGLGYSSYEKANLHGKNIPSLLQITNPSTDYDPHYLSNLPPYNPMPCITANGIDYTNKTYNEQYVDNILGPNPPLLTELNLTTEKYCFNRNVLNKKITLKMNIKSNNIAKTLKSWVVKGALGPNSELFGIFLNLKSNNVVLNGDVTDDDDFSD